MQTRWLAGAIGLMVVAACAARPSGVAVTPAGQAPTPSGRVLGGEVTGAQVGDQTKVALTGYYLDARGNRLNPLGQPTTQDLLLTVPVKDKRYGFDLPVPPAGVVGGEFGLLVYNDADGDNQLDAGEAHVVTGERVTYTPNVGYGIVRNGVPNQDPAALGQANLKFE